MERLRDLKLKKQLVSLSQIVGNGTSMISLHIKPTDQLGLIVKMLQTEMGTASNIKSQTNRTSVTTAIVCILQRLKLFTQMPENGIAIFSGDGITVDIIPNKPISKSLYFCDKRYHVENILETLGTDPKFGFVIIDGHGTLFGYIQGAERRVLEKITVDLPKKHKKGGQSSMRFARTRLEKKDAYVKKMTEKLTQHFIQNDSPSVEGIILAGSAEFKEDLNDSNFLDIGLRKKILKVVTVEHSMEEGFSEAIEFSSDVLGGLRFIEETNTLKRLNEDIRNISPLMALGKEVETAIEWCAVESLIIWEEHPEIDRYSEMDLKLHLISDKTGEGLSFINSYSGLAAFLKFPIMNNID